MSAVDERTAIGTLFKDGWGATTAVEWPNMKFTPNPDLAYVSFSIAQANAEQIEFGGGVNTKRAEGRVYVLVFVPKGTGDAEARVLAQQAAMIFKSSPQLTLPAGRILFREPTIRTAGSGATHFQINVSIPYLYDTL